MVSSILPFRVPTFRWLRPCRSSVRVPLLFPIGSGSFLGFVPGVGSTFPFHSSWIAPWITCVNPRLSTPKFRVHTVSSRRTRIHSINSKSKGKVILPLLSRIKCLRNTSNLSYYVRFTNRHEPDVIHKLVTIDDYRSLRPTKPHTYRKYPRLALPSTSVSDLRFDSSNFNRRCVVTWCHLKTLLHRTPLSW